MEELFEEFLLEGEIENEIIYGYSYLANLGKNKVYDYFFQKYGCSIILQVVGKDIIAIARLLLRVFIFVT